MTTDSAIFGLRDRPKGNLQPTQEELTTLLESTYKEDGRTPHAHDLTKYRQLVKDVETFKQHIQAGKGYQDLRKHLFAGVLDHTQFASQELLTAVAEYKYHRHALASLEFKTLVSFVKTSEIKIAKLDKKNIDDVVRIVRLQEMVDERNKILATLKKQWSTLSTELRQIALYIRDNLVRIDKLCEASIAVLADPGIKEKKEKQQVEDIKAYFKEQLRKALQHGQVTKQDLETAKKEVGLLSQALSTLVNEDVAALRALYEAIHYHAKKTAIEIAMILADIESKKNGSVEDKKALFARCEQVLVDLIADYRLEMKALPKRPETAHEDILGMKRKEMLDHLFEQVQKGRRYRPDRRASKDRRKTSDPNYKGVERRNSENRRTGKGRRK